MNKCKIFYSSNSYQHYESQINSFYKENPDIKVIDIQFSVVTRGINERSKVFKYCMITYKVV